MAIKALTKPQLLDTNACFSHPAFNSPLLIVLYIYTLARSHSLIQALSLGFMSSCNLSPPRINLGLLLSVPGPGAALWPAAAERQPCPGTSHPGPQHHSKGSTKPLWLQGVYSHHPSKAQCLVFYAVLDSMCLELASAACLTHCMQQCWWLWHQRAAAAVPAGRSSLYWVYWGPFSLHGCLYISKEGSHQNELSWAGLQPLYPHIMYRKSPEAALKGFDHESLSMLKGYIHSATSASIFSGGQCSFRDSGGSVGRKAVWFFVFPLTRLVGNCSPLIKPAQYGLALGCYSKTVAFTSAFG